MNQTHSFPVKKRKKTSNRQYYRQRLPCPACGFQRLIDTGQHTHSETHVMRGGDCWEADYYAKCPNPDCKADIGIRKLNSVI